MAFSTSTLAVPVLAASLFQFPLLNSQSPGCPFPRGLSVLSKSVPPNPSLHTDALRLAPPACARG